MAVAFLWTPLPCRQLVMCMGHDEASGSSAVAPLGGILPGSSPASRPWGSGLSPSSPPLLFLPAEVKMGEFLHERQSDERLTR